MTRAANLFTTKFQTNAIESRLQIPVRPKKNQETITALVIISSTGIDSQLQLSRETGNNPLGSDAKLKGKK